MTKGRVTAPGLNMHKSPGSPDVVHALAQGDEVHVTETKQHQKLWLFVSHRDQVGDTWYGWVCADFVELIPPKPSPRMPPVHHPVPAPREPSVNAPIVAFAVGVLVLVAFLLSG